MGGKTILPHLERDYKGTAWLSFRLNLALYILYQIIEIY